MEAPSKMTTLTPSVKSFTGGTNALKPVSSFTTKNMRHIRHPPTKNVTLSYPHVDLLMFGMVRLREVRHLKYIQFTDSLETVHQQTVI